MVPDRVTQGVGLPLDDRGSGGDIVRGLYGVQ